MAETQKTERLHNTVILTDRFPERRAAAGEPVPADDGATPLQPGERIDRYVIIDKLGGGGMGVVYKAQDTELGRTVALKVLPRALMRQGDLHARFRTEARLHARLNDPHTITLYSSLTTSAGDALVLEYVEGQTLEQRLRTNGPLAVDAAIDVFTQALDGVEHIHRMGIIHRDLKPSNIFLTRDGRVKLMDFGIARIADQHDPGPARAMVGTLLYIAPEQINGRGTDFRSDIYTLGISLFEAVTGRLPFERNTDYALMHAHAQEAPPRPKQFQRSLPAGLEWVILKAIEKNPDRRFRSAAQFRDALLTLTSRHAARRRHLPDAHTMRRELSRYQLVPNRHLLGGLGFDALLVAGVGVLLFGLGIVPFRSQPMAPPPATAVVAKPAPVRTVTTPRVATPPPVTRPAPVAVAKKAAPPAKPRIVKPAPAATPKDDPLENLRRLTGG
jgi:eukaryotic-like serine/threonine-protein kinase